MVAAGIFILLLLIVLAVLGRKPRLSLVLFFITAVCIALLFRHHATDALNISL